MLNLIMLLSLIFFVLIVINEIIIDRKPFSKDFKKAKKYTLLSSFLVLVFVAIIYYGIKFFIINPVYTKSFLSFSVVGFAALVFIFVHELITSIHIYRSNKTGKRIEEFTTNDKPGFLNLLTDFKDVKSENKEKRNYLKRLRVLVFPFMLCIYMFFTFGVTELYFANMNEWKFNFWDLLPFVGSVLVVGFIISAVLAVFIKGKLLDYLSVFISAVGIMSYIQANFLPQTTFIDGTATQTQLYEIILNNFLWLAIIIAAIYIYKFIGKTMLGIMGYISMVLIVIQIVPVPYMLNDGIGKMSGKSYIGYTLNGDTQFEVSGNNNVIVLIMDTYHSGDFRELLKKSPEYYDILSDFTFYDNVSTETFYTAFSMPSLLTCHDNDYTKSIIDSNAESWNSSNSAYFYENMQKNGYKVRLYTDNDVYSGGAQHMLGKIDNATQYEGTYVTDSFSTYLKMSQLSLYRYMPHAVKEFMKIDDSGKINNYTKASNLKDALNFDVWFESTNTSKERGICYYNSDFNDGLENRLTVTMDENLCIFQHLYGMHEPYYNISGENSDYEAAVESCMTVFSTYIENLKEIGVYDNSTIILTADHGYHYIQKSDPIMLIKPAGVTGSRLQINSAPGVLQKDLLPTILDCVGIEHSVLGYSLFDLEEDFKRTRIVRDFSWSSDYPDVKKCAAVGNAVYNCYTEYSYEGKIEEIDAWYEESKRYPIVDYWW